MWTSLRRDLSLSECKLVVPPGSAQLRLNLHFLLKEPLEFNYSLKFCRQL